MTRGPGPGRATVLLFVAAYLVMALVTLHPDWFGVPFELERVVWLPSGLAVAMTLRFGPRFAIWIFLAEAVATLLAGDGHWFALGVGAANALEAALAAVLLDRIGFLRSLARGRDVIALITVAAGLSALAGAIPAVTALVAFDPVIPTESWGRIVVLWWLTHANGMLLGTPLLLTLWHGSHERIHERPVEAMLAAVAVLTLGVVLFDVGSTGEMGRRLLYVPFPLLIWCAFRFRLPGAAAANLLLALPAMLATSVPAGPFAGGSGGLANDSLIQLWIFVAVNAATALFVAGVVEEREREIEARLAAEAERREMADRVHQAQHAESLGVLAGGVAHDFNNLLVSIMGNADLAERRLGDDHPAGVSVTEILRASQRAAEICRQMLAYAGRGRVSNGVVDLGEVAAEMTELLAVSFGPDTRVEVQIEDGTPPVWGDVTQLRRVVLNLLTNAVNALPDGSGQVRVSTGRLRPDEVDVDRIIGGETPEPGPMVHLTVEDDGLGVEPSVRERIFEPFFTTREMGRGLGLAAVTGIIRAHGGVIELRSRPGTGARFRAVLPVTDRASPGEPGAGELERSRGRVFRGRVLLVDDEEGVREVASEMLREAGADVTVAVDGVDAVEKYRQTKAPFRVVLLDLMMPRMDGFETLRELRRINPDVTVIVTTGNAEVAAEVEEKWGVQVLQKPYRSSHLRDVLRRATRA